ncbi:unnamed protein product [Bursaphelenchus xylophilus]|uniref:(pine wood nematode) hypothetical protein n=1 Tax=Bursaphelenchus xylophilus TaxID=6326 RepID=A0A1I7RIR1_BURXY|nr:unnamed protein product [Bursaphelenchus xylophilus]CAG9119031.1 unnamed protein product [Bursaphelenchus xylophilus]
MFLSYLLISLIGLSTAQQLRPEFTITARKIRQSDNSESINAVAGPQMCTAEDCNNHGTCFGTKSMPFCICQIGFAGARCQESYCDNTRECSGHGWCMGTTSQYTCLCNLGYSGTKCEIVGVAVNVTDPVTAEVREKATTLAPSDGPTNNDAEDEKQLTGQL